MPTISATATRPAIVLAVLTVAGVVAALMQSMVLPLLPQFPALLGVGTVEAQWIATSNMLAGAVTATLFGWLGDRVGIRQMIVVVLLLLAIGCAVSALATSLWLMIVGRVLQGVATSVMGLALAMARIALPTRRLPLAVGVVSGTLGVGTGLGIPLAAVMLAWWPWQSVFWVTGVLALVSAGMVRALVPDVPPSSTARFDLLGAVGFTLIVLLTLLPISFASVGGPVSPSLLAMAVGAVALALVWVRYQLCRREPFVDLRVAARPLIFASHLGSLLVGTTFFLSFTSTVYLSQTGSDGVGLGGSVFTTALVQTPASISAIAAASLGTWVAPRLGASRTVLLGTVCTGVAMVLRMADLSSLVGIALGAILVTTSATFTFSTLPLLLMASVDFDATAATNGLNVMMRQVGAAIASALAAAALTSAGTPTRTVFWLMLGAGAGLSFLASVILLVAIARPAHRLPSVRLERSHS